MSYSKLLVDGRWFEHFATAQKQLVTINATINSVNVNILSGFYYIEPVSLA